MTEFPCTIVYDFKLMRPGCAIVQTTFGATIGNDQLTRMDGWLTHPTDDMRLATIRTPEEMERVVALNQEVNA